MAGRLGVKPGWARVSFSYYLSEAQFEYILEAVHLIATYGARIQGEYRFDVYCGQWSHRAAPAPADGLAGVFYDDAGARLFEEICEQPEYYLTRAELEILRASAGEIGALAGPRCALVEWGSWRWAFLVNVPVGLVAVFLARRNLVESRSPGRRRIPDVRGAVLLAASLGLGGMANSFISFTRAAMDARVVGIALLPLGFTQ